MSTHSFQSSLIKKFYTSFTLRFTHAKYRRDKRCCDNPCFSKLCETTQNSKWCRIYVYIKFYKIILWFLAVRNMKNVLKCLLKSNWEIWQIITLIFWRTSDYLILLFHLRYMILRNFTTDIWNIIKDIIYICEGIFILIHWMLWYMNMCVINIFTEEVYYCETRLLIIYYHRFKNEAYSSLLPPRLV